jgi:Mrp family chromosome partitioning ATPase
MSSIVQIFKEPYSFTQRTHATTQEYIAPSASRLAPLRREQIESLVHELFLQHAIAPLRRVGFAASEETTQTGQVCFDVAQVLAEESSHDVGLIDATSTSEPLEVQFQVEATALTQSESSVAPHLWFVPRRAWMPDNDVRHITEQNMNRLRELAAEFDFSILCCPSVSPVTARIGRACDGIVLVLQANKTRRLVACQMKDRLRRAQVRLLGTVLTERRFPIPRGLYRSL